ncbi:phage tail assembly chaperone [Pseudomonas sp. NPDC089428]|uniref:phage tail assembly chaperone n=1 Tax=Pseudomonas sp. NPDC089428 TaxID=3364467 RepID=UPI0037FF1991
MTEFEINGITYRIGKMTVFQQFHLERKVAPLIPKLVPVFLKLQGAAQEGKSANPLTGDLSATVDMLSPFMDAIASMEDDQAEFILGTSLSVVSRKQGEVWSPVWSSRGNVAMFDDIDMNDMLKMTYRVILEALGPFIKGMLTGPKAPTKV